MKKILVVLNSNIFSHHVIASAINIASTSRCLLHGIFMDPVLEESYDYAFPNDLSLTMNNYGKTAVEERNETLEAGMNLFEDMCHTAGVNCFTGAKKTTNLLELIEHSAFADLILTDASENFDQHHIIDLITDTCCPVYFVSKNVEKVKQIILTYDGSFSSINAIKQYAMVFPEMKGLPTHFVHVTSEDSDEFPREKNIKTWLPELYSNVEFKILHGDVRTELLNFAGSIPDSLVVMGSFKKNSISRLFHEDLANAVIADGRSALFIVQRQGTWF